MNPIMMHINYAEPEAGYLGDKLIERACSLAAESGFDGVEFRGKVPKTFGDMSFREYAEKIARAKKEYSLSNMMFVMNISGYIGVSEAERNAVIRTAVEEAKIANQVCGMTLCNVRTEDFISKNQAFSIYDYEYHGSRIATQQDWDESVYTFQCIGHELEKIGLRLAFETHMLRLHDLPAICKRFVDLIDSPMIGLNMDYGNTVYFPEYPNIEDTIDLYADKLFYTHLKNSISITGTRRRMPTALADGQINHAQYLKKLLDSGFSGPIGIEAPRDGDRAWFAKADFEYFKSLL